MVRHTALSLLAAVVGPGGAAAQTGPLDAVAFMAGTWCSAASPNGTVIEEHYTTVSANLVLGTTRYLQAGATVGYELTRIDADSAGVVLTPTPSGQAPVPFRLTDAAPGLAVFENPGHDFPVRIEYRRMGEMLVARVEGRRGGESTWRMTPCPPEQAPDAAPGGGTAGGPPTGEGDVRTIEGAARVSGEGARTSGAFTQESDEAGVFGRLRGSWEGSGTLFGSPARFSMRWDTTDGLARLHFSNALEEEGGGTTPVLTAFATYRTAEPAEGIWLDSRGETLMLTWTQDGDALVVSWRSLEESGRTTYRTLTEDAVEVLDEVSTPDGFSVFGRARYTRVAPAP